MSIREMESDIGGGGVPFVHSSLALVVFPLSLSLYTCLFGGDEGNDGGMKAGTTTTTNINNRHMHVRTHARVRVVESGMEHLRFSSTTEKNMTRDGEVCESV